MKGDLAGLSTIGLARALASVRHLVRGAVPIMTAAALLVGALAATVLAQERVARIAVLELPSRPLEDAFGQFWRALLDGLRERGWVEGRNLAIESRWTGGHFERLREAAAELVASRPDVLLVNGSQPTAAARQVTASIPIVMVNAGNPVEAGFVASLARPGGNVTGVSNQFQDTLRKQLELLKEIRPTIVRVGLLWDPDNPGSVLGKDAALAAAPLLGLAIEPVAISTSTDVDAAFALLAQSRPDALQVHPTPTLRGYFPRLLKFSIEQRVPTVTATRQPVVSGLLMSYGPDFVESWERAANYVDRILRGARPAELPVEQPTKFELVINLRTARAIGLDVPPSILAFATELVE